ncbi:MAG: NAD(P)-binding domain-containing protein [Myxococcota bacterium]
MVPVDHSERLLVIGAGPTGLAMAKALAEAGIPYTQVEATHDVGGNWAHGVYETAHIISSRKTTEFADFPMPATYPDFPSGKQMHAYFQAYAEAFGLRDTIRFGAEVTQVAPDGAGWVVQLGDGTRERYKGVVVCNGHHWARVFPAWTKDFTGEVLHSKDYKRPDQLAGKRVLIVGGGNSGCDLASEAARVGLSADWSLRRGYWFLPKTIFGRPTVELLHPWMPVPIQRQVIRALIRIVIGRYSDYGLPEPDHALFEAHPSICTEIFHYLKHGRLTPRPDVASVAGRIVTFTDGTTGEYDVVALGTGFDLSYPFLPEGTVPVVRKVPQLYAGMLRPEHRHLWVVGGLQVRYGIGPLLRPLGLLLADWVRLQDEVAIPLGELMRRSGEPLPTTHLVDPHASIRRMALGRKVVPLLRWRARRMGVLT